MERGLRLTIAALIALGAVARLAPLFDQNGRMLQQFPTEDAYFMLTVARNLALGHGMSVSDGTILSNGVQPLAMALWSACFWIVGGAKHTGVALVLVAELAINAASALALWRLAERALAGTRQPGLAAMLAAAVWWASPAGMPHAMNGLETGLYAGAVIAVALGFVAPGTEGAWSFGRQLRFGLALGVAFLARSDAVFLILWACLIHPARPIEGRGRAPLRRLGEALVFGALSVVVAAPWLVFNYLAFGRSVAIRGQLSQNLSRVPGVLVELAGMVAPIPRALQESWPVIAACAVACALGLAAAFVAWRRSDASRRTLIALATLFTLSLSAFYGLCFGAGDFMERYLFPASPFFAIAWAWALVELVARVEARGRAQLGSAALAGAFALALAGNVQLYARGDSHTHFQVVRWVDANVPDDVWIGAAQTGTLGFFHDRTVSLDALTARKRGAQVEYLVSDRADAVEFLREPALAARYEVLVHDADQSLGVLKRKPPRSESEPEPTHPDAPE